ncbi:MAG TPA: polysaccharide lyase family 7 protein [Terriglobales bacterium]|nr:polysaccharide lyase family 7 protein [Terriglobales bacterium]
MLHVPGSSADKTKKNRRNRFLVWRIASAAVLLAAPLTLFAAPPGSNFNLSYWNLETPVGNGSPMVVSSSQLQNGFVNGAYFFTNSSDGSMVMKEPGTNCTAWPGTHCRTEFHEVDPSSGQYMSWSPSGTNKLDASLYVTQPGGGIVISQVFLNDSFLKPLGELEYTSNGDISMNIENAITGGTGETGHFIGHANVNETFSYEISYSNNTLSVAFNGGSPQFISVPGYANGIQAFFKAGCYGQSTQPSDVHFTQLTISHGGGGGGGGLSTSAWYNIVNQNSGSCVDDAAWGTSNGSIVQQWACGNQQSNQEWQLQTTDSGYYRLVNRHAPSLVWDVANVSTSPGGKIQLWNYGGGLNQQWQPQSLGNGFYQIVSRNTGLCLDVPSASTANGVQLQQWTCNGSGAQAWQFNQQP